MVYIRSFLKVLAALTPLHLKPDQPVFSLFLFLNSTLHPYSFARSHSNLTVLAELKPNPNPPSSVPLMHPFWAASIQRPGGLLISLVTGGLTEAGLLPSLPFQPESGPAACVLSPGVRGCSIIPLPSLAEASVCALPVCVHTCMVSTQSLILEPGRDWILISNFAAV